MAFDLTVAELKVYRRLIDDGPTFGSTPEKVQRWRKECLDAAVAIREALWMDSDDGYSREKCLSMSVYAVQRPVARARTP